MPRKPRPFRDVLRAVGRRPKHTATQNASRHYSECLSREFALWVREHLIAEAAGKRVLPPEARVPTIYGHKSLDVAVIDDREYLVLDLSIKTFNFKDRVTGNYRHNYTGRFYELLGEELDLRRSYRLATLVAVIVLPVDSATDSAPSSFAHAVRQFSKILGDPLAQFTARFDHVFVGLHSNAGEIYFFDAASSAPAVGEPPKSQRSSIREALRQVLKTVDQRAAEAAGEPIPVYRRYSFRDGVESVD